ncbi:MAG: chromate transporter [Paludibacteraceae bacterium]|nr:chromate transporter [Paludibacteraceae bacterium]
MIFLQLFLSFLKIGLFGFGGGLAILSLIQHEVESHGWMTSEQFVDIVAVSQVTPGPIGINCATYVGFTATNSVWGSVIATSAIVLPSLVIMLLLCKLYFVLNARFQRSIYFQQTMRMLRFSVLGLIAAAALCLMTPVSFIDWRSWVIFVVVSVLTIAPQYIQMTDSNGKNAIYLLRKSVQIISHPIILIVLAGLVGYFIYA